MLDTEQSPEREVQTLSVSDKSAMWKLGIASGLVAVAVFGMRRSARGAKTGVASKAHVVNGSSAPGSDEGENNHPAESGSKRFAVRNRQDSVGGPNDRPLLAVPAIAFNVTGTVPIKLSRAMKALGWVVTVSLMVLLFTAVFNAVQSNFTNRSPDRLSSDSPQAALPGEEAPSQAEQRAWIGVSLPKAYPLTKEGGGFAIELRNFGKTPALQVSVTDVVVIEELDRLTGAQDAASHRPVAVGTLIPGGGFATDIWFKTNAEGVAGLSEGKVRAVNYSWVTYEDIFHRMHTTRSCSYWRAGLPAPLPCEGFNTLE